MDILRSIENWLHLQNPLEITGVITGLLCVLLAALNNIWNWPLAIVNVCIYIIIFFRSKLYADMGLQVYLLGMNIYGWYYWSIRTKTQSKKPIVRITRKEVWLSFLGTALFTYLLGFILRKNTDAAFPFIDSFCTACSLIAQVFLARKVIENWLIWIFIDLIYVGVYTAKDLHLTAGMYAVYVIIALVGYIDWKKGLNASLSKVKTPHQINE